MAQSLSLTFHGAARVRLSGEDIDVRAQIRRIDAYSAHADMRKVLASYGEFREARKQGKGKK